MDFNYVFSTLLFTMSCSTASLSSPIPARDDGVACPVSNVHIPVEQNSYMLSLQSLSYIPSQIIDEINDFGILMSFAKRYFAAEVPVSEDIQRVIENDFWDML